MGYQGPDRRIHRVFVTRNTEYHVRSRVCVAVRDRKTDSWLTQHPALGRTMEGSLRFLASGIIPSIEDPSIGDSIYFRREERDVITSRVERVARPPREVVARYTA